jgi:MoaA/NifB/PqqE/SkfB family radical SAM enzyme
MSFTQICENALVRYEPYGEDIYLLVDNNLRLIKKGSQSYIDLKEKLEIIPWDENYFSVPKNVQIQITKACNFKCSFCYANAINSGKPEFYMPKDKLLEIIDRLYSCGVISVQYVGGETFMHKAFPEVVEYAKKLGLNQTIITNGIIPGLKIEKYHEMISSFSKIQVSVNAAGERYDNIVGLKSYDRLLKALGNICKYNKSVWLSFVVTEQSLEDIETIIELSSSTGCAGVRFGILIKQGRGSDKDLTYFSILKEASDLLANAQKKHPNVKIECHFNPALNQPPREGSHYSEGISMLFMNLEGDIFPFPLLEVEEMKLGNVFKDDLINIWRNNPILEQFRGGNAINPECGECKTPCTLRAPAVSYLWKGSIGKKVPCYKYNFEK